MYDLQYDIAAIVITALLFIFYFLRRSYVSKANTIFICLIMTDLAAAVFDALSCMTVSDPDSYPMFLSYLFTLGFLFFYPMLAVVFFMYIDSKARIKAMQKITPVASWVVAFYLGFCALSSPWTHWLAYFDENGGYHQGPLMFLNFGIAFVSIYLDIMMVLVAKNRFNNFQIMTLILMIVMMIGGIVVQLILPRVVIGSFCVAVILVFIYISFENPAHFTYMDTSCYNRQAFLEEIYRKYTEGDKYNLIVFSFLDSEYIYHTLDAFEMDELSVKIATFIYKNFKKKAFCISEDKYVIVMDNIADEQGVITTINAFFSKPVELTHTSIELNVFTRTLNDVNRMFDVSDVENMISYVVKHPKDMKSIQEIHDSVVFTKHKREKMLLCMKRAIENESFEVYYQPIYSTKTGRFESCEALVRLFDEELGMLDPEEMVVLAEKNGLIDKIGDIIFRKVCKFMQDNDYASLGLKYIEVNLSTVQCMKLSLPDSIRGIMDHYQIPSNAINLEITETAELEDEGTLLKNVRTLDKMGVKFSIDDYGSGFASAGYLIKFPVSLVKIDKSILWNAIEDKDAMVVLKHTIAMVQELDKHIVVEGVETNEMKNILVENGVDYLQGYLFSKPIPADKFVDFLNRNNTRYFDEEDEEMYYYSSMNASMLSGMSKKDDKKKEPPKKKKVLRSGTTELPEMDG